MRGIPPTTTRKSLLIALAAMLALLGPARGQQAPATSAERESKAEPVVPPSARREDTGRK